MCSLVFILTGHKCLFSLGKCCMRLRKFAGLSCGLVDIIAEREVMLNRVQSFAVLRVQEAWASGTSNYGMLQR